jgi:predicted dehydrogenase
LFFDLASHTLDVLDFLLGPIKKASGFASNQSGAYFAEDIVTGSYLFESGVHGMGTWCFSAADFVDRSEIVGSKGRLVYSTFDTEPVRLIGQDGVVAREWSLETPMHIQQPLIQTIVDELTGRGVCASTGVSAARTNWVMDQLVKGYYGKK